MARIIIVSTGTLAAFFWALSPVWALDNPTTVNVGEVNAYRSVVEEDDLLIIFRYNIGYAAIPGEPVSETFLTRLMDTDGTTQIGVNTPEAYHDNGYGEGLASLYLTAAQVTAAAVSWNDALVVRVDGNPSSFYAPPTAGTATLSTGAYSTGDNSRDNNQSQLTARVLAICQELQVLWGGSPLVDDTIIGTRLTAAGELFLSLAIPGIRTMAPDAYTVRSLDPDIDPNTFTTTGQTGAEERYKDTFWLEAFNSLNKAWGLPSNTVQMMLYIAMALFIAWLSHYMWGKVEPGFGFALMALPVFWYMGWLPFQFAAIILFVVGAIAVTGLVRVLFRGVA